ncbi:DMT family transporter [Lampropedia puyangensis]|uniref:DMT family transporter n=1 Tax=Lampropedia puyangensis TaxID=1330072 RepID=A0A4S8EPP8_9BURK|nr:DMT family transporter [Lampropedia puyangensis]THT96178.1 DMT family transporter [Lampropedia puyangensis]
MDELAAHAWIWIPVVVLAAAAQTVRNTAQRSLSGGLGTWPATLVRFLYGLPFAATCLVLLYCVPEQAPIVPHFSLAYGGWIAFGALFQVAATAALLLAMQAGNFAVSITFSKTEVLQLMLFGSVFLGELPVMHQIVAAVLATLGVVLLAWPNAGSKGQAAKDALMRASLFGLLCGACFALATLGFRGAAVNLQGVSPWVSAAWGVVFAQALQTVVMSTWLAWRDREGLLACLRSWRVSLLAGCMGAMASLLWFSAYAMQTAAAVRALGMVEVLFGYLVSRKILHEKLRVPEKWGIALVVLAVVLIGLPL